MSFVKALIKSPQGPGNAPEADADVPIIPNQVPEAHGRKKWRFCRRCSEIPNFFYCIALETGIYLAIFFSFFVNSFL